MSAEIGDPELLEGLRQARRKPRHFVLITKGPEPLKLLVNRKRPRDGALRLVKSEVHGNDLIRGVVEGDGGKTIFKVVGEEPIVKPARLRELIAEQTELLIRPIFEVVSELPDVR
jgi:hypothetical protein